MSAQCDVKKKTMLETYPAFGEMLYSIVSENLPYGVVKNKNAVVNQLRQHPELGFDTSCAYAWLKGNVLGSKPLINENFKRILLFYWGKNGLSTLEEINGWIALGPPQYEEVLKSAEVQNKLRLKNILKQPGDQEEELAGRQKLWKRLHDQICRASQNTRPSRFTGCSTVPNLIIIQGPPGVGKTMFLNRLWADPIVQSRFDEVLRVSCDAKMTPRTFLDLYLRKLFPEEDWSPGSLTVLKADLHKAIRGKRILLLADNLSSLEEIEALRPLCEMGCLLVGTTRYLEVARQTDYGNVFELTAYSISDIAEYFSKNISAETSFITQDKLIQLAKMVCFNPLGLNIALRRVAEEGWDAVVEKVNLAPPILKEDIFKALHKPLWLAFSSLSADDQNMFRRLGILPALACYDEERLSLFWGVSRTKANEILVRLEKEAGLTYRDHGKSGCWHFHPQVLNYARYLFNETPYRTRVLSHLYPARVAFHERRPHQFNHMYRRGIKREILKEYWKMIRAEGKRRRLPIVLAELRRFVDPTYSTDWSIFTQLTSNCTFEDYIWGYRTYLEGALDIWFFFGYLFLIGILGGLQRLVIQFGLLTQDSILLGMLNLFLLSSALLWAFHMVLRDLRRRYDWAQLWQKVTKSVTENKER